MPTPAPIAYSTAAFRREREADWQAFEQLVQRLESGSIRRLSDDDLIALPRYYRATLSSLSLARATSLDVALIDYLESLAMRGYFLLYGIRESRSHRFLEFFRTSWPAAVRALWRETLVIALLLVLGVVVSWSLVAHDPEWFHRLVGEEMAQGRVPGASVATLRDTVYGEPEGGGLHIFAAFLFTHNSQVSITAYALGFAFGLPSMFLLMYQGIPLGSMMAVFHQAGLGLDFAAWLSIHGTTELYAAILSGAAGLKIGTAFAFPGHRSRLAAASEAGKATATVMIGVIIMLLCAGLLEGFGRQLIQSMALRFTIGGTLLAFWLSYFYIPRRRSVLQAHPA
jgi:uncharacterized membrane protein SpoIIM required for sporulation